MSGVPFSGGVGLALTLALGEAALGGADEVEPVHLLLGICKACDMQVSDAGFDVAFGAYGAPGAFGISGIPGASGSGPGVPGVQGVPGVAAVPAQGVPADEADRLRAAFARAGLDTAAFRRRLRADVARRERGTRGGKAVAGSGTVRRLLERAAELSATRHGDVVTLSELLVAVLETPTPPWTALATRLGVPDLHAALFPHRPHGPGQPPRAERAKPAHRPEGGARSVSDARPPLPHAHPGPDEASGPRGPARPGEPAGPGVARVAFTVLEGPLAGRVFAFADRTTCVVGRADDCTLRLPGGDAYSGISRHHCLLDINPPDVRVRDLGSANGTYVNGEKIGQRNAARTANRGRPSPSPSASASAERELADGDEIGLGGVRLRVGVSVPARCATCGKPLPVDGEAGPAGTQGAGGAAGRHCALCRTTVPPSEESAAPPPAEPACAACGSRLAAGHTVEASADELCTACKGDPERVMRQLLQVAGDGTRSLHLFGGYTIQRQLGRGGMGAVYLARDQQTEELCALKVMLPQAGGSETAKARFLREMSTVEMLRHPHLVRLQDHGRWNGIYFFVMDYCDGGDVAGLVHRRGGRLPDYQAVGITLQVLDGLAHAHQADVRAYDLQGRPLAVRGLVHRDLSPRNIFLDGGVAKVGDFGLAKAFDAAGLSGLTHTGTSAGKPSFVSRQQVLQFKRAQPEVDVWAAAACLYYMLTGTAPRDFPPGVDRWRVVLDSPAVPIRRRNPDVPERLAEVVDHALTEQPAIGFGTAAEFRRALLEARP